ncbi:MAG: hypothetical protein ACYC27_19115 [Armatimonadota bacterium]
MIFLISVLCLSGICAADEIINNESVIIKAVKTSAGYTGFDLLSSEKHITKIRFGSRSMITARKCYISKSQKRMTFNGLTGNTSAGLSLGLADRISIYLDEKSAYPHLDFNLHIKGFDESRWLKVYGKQPFHFISMYMPDAEVWHQCGWLNETPVADPFPLLIDPHVGSPELSAYLYNRNWSYTVPLGAHPVPVIGLWAPKKDLYAGLEFQTTRLDDNSEKDIATAYCWGDGKDAARKPNPSQFIALVYPFGGEGYQSLVFPKTGSRISSKCALLWSSNLSPSGDPNRFFYEYIWNKEKDRLPTAPDSVDLSWIPGEARLKELPGPGSDGLIIRGVESNFQVPDSKQIISWFAFNESIAAHAKKQGDTKLISQMEEEAKRLVGYAKRTIVRGDECIYWDKPLEGRWTDEWGGAPVATIQNSESFAAGHYLLRMYRDLGKKEYLEYVDGVMNWAKYIGWTRNEFADVPSSPFAIGSVYSVPFLLDYYMTFKDSDDEHLRNQASPALDLVRTFMYRHMSVWVSDNNRSDNLDSSFLFEPTSGRDWTGSACSNEMSIVLNVLAATSVHTGDPFLLRITNGALARFHQLYQVSYKNSISEYKQNDFTEVLALYDGVKIGVGNRANFGAIFPLTLLDPPGDAIARVIAGEKAVIVTNRNGSHTKVDNYVYTPDGNLSFSVNSNINDFNMVVTVPYVDISGKSLTIIRDGKTTLLEPERDYTRPSQAVWSLIINDVKNGDRIIIGQSDENDVILLPKPAESHNSPLDVSGFRYINLPYNASTKADWNDLNSWVGMPQGNIWLYDIPFTIREDSTPNMLTDKIAFKEPVSGTKMIAVVYSFEKGKTPEVVFSDGSRSGIVPQLESLAWRAWPPIFSKKLLIAPVRTDGKTVTGIDPGGTKIFAVTAIDDTYDAEQVKKIIANLSKGNIDWQKLRTKLQMVDDIKQKAHDIPADRIAILPPKYSGPVTNFMQQLGLLAKSRILSAEELIDPVIFNAKLFPVAVYASGEDYIHTVKEDGDGLRAVADYVKDGGCLFVVAPTATFPFYFANGPGFRRGDLGGDKIGLPIKAVFESTVPEKLTYKLNVNQKILKNLVDIPYSNTDVRLRAIDEDKLMKDIQYTPVYSVVGVSGKKYADAGAVIKFSGGGEIVFVYGSITADMSQGDGVALSIVSYMVDKLLGSK